MRFVLTLLLIIAPLPAGPVEDLRALIRKELTASEAPSLAVAVARNGEVVWAEGFGWADREKRRPATEHTIYSLASISKPITATGLMVLVEQGRMDLDKPVNDYLGVAKLQARIGDAREATVRRVASHTAGLPLHYQFFYEDEPYRRPSMDETILRYGNLFTPPGERYLYSNLGYGVLDYVISRVSGKSYEAFMREEVFVPLGLTRMSVHVGPGLAEFQATRYAPDGARIPFYDFDHPGGSAIYSSAHDLVRFAMLHLKTMQADQKPVLKEAAIDQMRKPVGKLSARTSYGIGWSLTENPGGYRIAMHTGGMGGVSTALLLIPDEKLAVAALSNARTDLPHRMADEILARYLPKWKRSEPAHRQAAPPLPAALRGEWKGTVSTYKGDLPLTLDIRGADDVHARLGAQPPALLNQVAFRDNLLTGRMMGDIGTEDANRRSYSIQFSLVLRGSVLNGAATAMSLPSNRVGNALSHWVELKK
ncbi:MAG: beta-lactamase family protein [Acidimicrobiia bacterium]|nr:beta-lactamase family protein [Acidimicrobiia bacterium]